MCEVWFAAAFAVLVTAGCASRRSHLLLSVPSFLCL
jgi:hypothetical protein